MSEEGGRPGTSAEHRVSERGAEHGIAGTSGGHGMDESSGGHGMDESSGGHGKPGTSAEPGMPGNPVKLTDPKMMRALAHPARIAIWTHIAMRGPTTATECAEVAGLSPSACSYHLRTLARYGFIEEDRASAADGRERPWRARLLAFTMEDRPDTPPAGRLASRLLVENLREAAEEIRARYLDRKYEYPADWQAAAGEMFSVAHVTPEELQELRAKVLDLLEPYIRLEEAERSPGALPVRVMFDLFPWFRPEEANQASQRAAAPPGPTSDEGARREGGA
jgi:DNA-binding MarR family transcriptional regulator